MNRQWLGLVFVAAVGVAIAAAYFLGPDPYRAALSDREVAAHVLARTVASRQPGKKMLVFSNPFIKRKSTDRRIVAMEEAGLRGLKTGAEGRSAIGAVVYPELRPVALKNPRAVPIDTETTTPLSYLVAPDAFDRAAQAHPDCEILVSLIGLPVELDQCDAWNKVGPPAFALLLPDLRMVGGANAVASSVKSGKLLAIVLRKPGGVSESEPVGRDHQAEFERRFVLVTADNVDDVAARTPGLLENP
jgi:hypothetical protein